VRFVGIDLGATRFHVAVLEGDGVVVGTSDDIDDVVRWCAGAERIAIDAPSEPATGRVHLGTRSAKFAVARCNEIAAGEQLGVWVPWVTPTIDACPPWMVTGFALWDALRVAGHDPIEVYPAGCFWLLNGRRWPAKKSTPAGRAARRALLPIAVESESHDHIDAAMAAVVARGPSIAVGHIHPGCDGSQLFVPAAIPITSSRCRALP
jgi:predicted nuclease with RNAse H fold